MTTRPRSRLRPFATAFLVVGLTLIVSCSGSTLPAAVVGGTDITDEQLAHDVRVFEFVFALLQKPCGTKETGETETSACSRYTLSSVIEEHFAAIYAADHAITVSDADIKPTLDNLDQQFGKDKVDQLLTAHGLTRDDLNDFARRSLLLGDVQSAVTEERLPLHQLYEQNILDYTTVQVDHILVKTRAEAEDVYAQVTAPGATAQTFTDLARQVSIDPTAKQNGGSLGSATASGYVHPFGVAAAALEPGEISQPVHTRYGWHVIRMVSKDVTSFADAKQDLIDQHYIVEFKAWLRDQVAAHGVKVNPRFGRYDVKLLQVERIASTATGVASVSPSATS